MKVRLRLIGPCRLPPEGRDFEYRCRRGSRVRAILKKTLGYSDREMGFLQISRDGRLIALDEPITEDTDLQITLRLGGG